MQAYEERRHEQQRRNLSQFGRAGRRDNHRYFQNLKVNIGIKSQFLRTERIFFEFY